MEKTLEQLAELILKALPTFAIIILLHFYLKYIFFRPLQKVLRLRHEATEGARRLAEETLGRVNAKAAEYDAALKAARGEIYRDQEAFRQKLRQEHAEALQTARREARSMVEQARQSLDQELAAAQESLSKDTESLAAQIVQQILYRRPA